MDTAVEASRLSGQRFADPHHDPAYHRAVVHEGYGDGRARARRGRAGGVVATGRVLVSATSVCTLLNHLDKETR